MTYYTYFSSPLQPLLLVSNGTALTALYMDAQNYRPEVDSNWKQNDAAAPFSQAREQLAAYFRGELQEFSVPLSPQGTPFQVTVWEELRRIPYGETISYGELARRVGRPGAARAVGLANGRNPLGLIIPCHRVIGADGSLTGYGGGLDRKTALLRFEAAVRASGPAPFPAAGLASVPTTQRSLFEPAGAVG